MILPIYTYGTPVLREKTIPVEANSEELQSLIDDMIETMHHASGVGLAAPQVGRTERLFVVDVSLAREDDDEQTDGPSDFEAGPVAFINPELHLRESAKSEFEEGCLSIPELREDVIRPDEVKITFLDRDLAQQELVVDGLFARVIQHEFDHLNGILFVDHLSPLKKRLLRRRLREMARGEITADYPVVTPVSKKWKTSESIG